MDRLEEVDGDVSYALLAYLHLPCMTSFASVEFSYPFPLDTLIDFFHRSNPPLHTICIEETDMELDDLLRTLTCVPSLVDLNLRNFGVCFNPFSRSLFERLSLSSTHLRSCEQILLPNLKILTLGFDVFGIETELDDYFFIAGPALIDMIESSFYVDLRPPCSSQCESRSTRCVHRVTALTTLYLRGKRRQLDEETHDRSEEIGDDGLRLSECWSENGGVIFVNHEIPATISLNQVVRL
ncbi:hypothetical protein AAF712_010432 [Marasmius tenuissimus]|uniref:Uncharacterized protein n=1 Tax=Marasmius tenuissimus TaxID=585030 RepID=A0ABR2ZLW2_9AGAR